MGIKRPFGPLLTVLTAYASIVNPIRVVPNNLHPRQAWGLVLSFFPAQAGKLL
jgi:hypothetical protein